MGCRQQAAQPDRQAGRRPVAAMGLGQPGVQDRIGIEQQRQPRLADLVFGEPDPKRGAIRHAASRLGHDDLPGRDRCCE